MEFKEDEGDKSPLSKEAKQELALKDDVVGRVPKSAEGIWSLEELIFKAPFVETLLASLRKRLFQFIHEHKSTLDQIAREVLAREEEAINMALDQRLRRHTNRKGEVQVEWFFLCLSNSISPAFQSQ